MKKLLAIGIYPWKKSYPHIYPHINVVLPLLFQTPPFGVTSLTQDRQFPFLPPTVHYRSYGIPADVGAEPFHISNAEGAQQVLQGIFHQLQSLEPRPGRLTTGPLLKFPVGQPPGGEQVVEPGQEIMLVFMPTGGTRFQDSIIIFLGLFHEPLMADIPPDLIAMLVESQQSQQPGNTAVAISEWVNAEEIQDQAGRGQERRDLQLVKGVAISLTQFGHGLGNLLRGKGLKADLPAAIGKNLNNVVGLGFPLASVAAGTSLGQGVKTETGFRSDRGSGGNQCESS